MLDSKSDKTRLGALIGTRTAKRKVETGRSVLSETLLP
jgi:hypothetical protein